MVGWFRNPRLRSTVAAAAAATGLLLTACGDADSPSDSAGGRALVVTTTTQLTDFVRVLGGDRVVVYDVVKANVDPHDYEPTPLDINAIADADLIVKNGIGVEEWLEDTIATASSDAPVVDASAGVDVHVGEGGEGDPHIWHDPTRADAMVATIAEALTRADPEGAAAYETNRVTYSRELSALDGEIRGQIDSLANRKLVTNHDAFGYYVERYSLDFVGAVVPSFDSQAELSVKETSDLVAAIRAQGVKAVFSESSLPPKTAGTIASEAGVRVVAGDDALYGDSLGPPGSAGDTYLKMMRHNTRAIVDNLA